MRRLDQYGLQIKPDLWRVPFLMCLAWIVAFVITAILDKAAANGELHLPWWLSVGNVDDARAVLTAMLGAVSTVLALIFSVALLVLSMAVTQFGSRILYRFIRDGVTQATIGFFLASFIHTLLAIVVTHKQFDHEFVPQLTIFCSIGTVIVSFALLVIFSHRIATSIQTQHVVSSIVADVDKAMDEIALDLFQDRLPPATPETAAEIEAIAARCEETGGVIRSARSGFVQEVDVPGLLAAADEQDVVIRLLHRPGQFLMKDAPLCQIIPPTQALGISPLVHRAVKLGPHRTLKQDVEFGIAQLVEIALRALSSAINDTFTGLTCIDWLGDELRAFANHRRSLGAMLGKSARIRLTWPVLHIERVVKSAFDQIRQSAIGNPAVSIRLLQTCSRLAEQIPDAECKDALLQQVEAIWEAVPAQNLVRCDVRDIEKAYQTAREILCK